MRAPRRPGRPWHTGVFLELRNEALGSSICSFAGKTSKINDQNAENNVNRSQHTQTVCILEVSSGAPLKGVKLGTFLRGVFRVPTDPIFEL
jgi:hypothetical protein